MYYSLEPQICRITYIAGLAKGYSNSIVNALELLQPFTKPSICALTKLPIIASYNVLVPDR